MVDEPVVRRARALLDRDATLNGSR